MATIQKREDKFHVQIRKKNMQLSATFADRETAELWAKYKEDVYDELQAFSPPLEEMFTLKEAILLKAKKLEEDERSQHAIRDTLHLEHSFEPFLDVSMDKITFEDLSKHCERMLNTVVRRGGNLEKGRVVQQSHATVYKKFRYLSVVFSFMQENGMKLVNHPLAILRELEKRDKPSFEEQSKALRSMCESIGL